MDPATTRPWPLACENCRKLNYPKWPVTREARAIQLSPESRRSLCRYTVTNFAYRHLARAPSARQNVLISIAHCRRRGVRRAFLSFPPLHPIFLSNSFELFRRDRINFAERNSLFLFSSPREKKRRIRVLKDPCVSPRRERVEKSRILEGTESRMGTSDSRRESVYPSNWSNFQRSRFHCNPILPIFSSPLILITDLTTQKKDHRSDSSQF